jgi:hypothetical protein
VCFIAPLVAFVSPVAMAQPLPTNAEILLRVNDVVGGVRVRSIDSVSINSSGDWIATVNRLVSPSTGAVIASGQVLFKVGDPLAAGNGVIMSWGNANLSDDGAALWPMTSSLGGEGLYRTLGTSPPSLAAAKVQSIAYSGGPWLSMPRAITLDASRAMIIGSVDDPQNPTLDDAGIFAMTLDAAGVQASVVPLVVEGNVISAGSPPTSVPLQSILIGTTQSDAASFETFAWLGKLRTPPAAIANDDVAMFGPSTALAREGSTSVITSRTYGAMGNNAVAVNAQGDWVIRAALSGLVTGNAAIIRNGVVFASKGEPFAAIPNSTVEQVSAGNSPVRLDDSGRVWWWCDWSSTDLSTDSAILCDSTIVLREGQSIGNQQIVSFRAGDANFAIDRAGRRLISVVTLAGNVDAVVRVSPPPVVPGDRCSPADVADDAGAALPSAGVNNGLTEGDYNLFFANFFDANPVCDIASDDGTPLPPFGTTTGPNNGVTEADYNVFFATYFDGCAF